MKRNRIFLFMALVCISQIALFAGGDKESPTRHHLYGKLEPGFILTDEIGSFGMGAGYEGAIGQSFSLGGYAGMLIDDEGDIGGNLLLKPRFYFGKSSLEKFFIGANVGVSIAEKFVENETYYGYSSFDSSYYATETLFSAGLETGYKFVFGSGSLGFSFEPAIGYDFILDRLYFGLSLGYAFGGGQSKPRPVPAPAPVAPSAVKDGIYVGIITFGPDAQDITGGNPIHLDEQGQGLAQLTSLLNRYQRENTIGTALFYSAHLALANMKKAESRIPQNDLANVTLFTFTDGLDVSSTGLSLPAINDPGNTGKLDFAGGDIRPYMNFVKGEIDNRKINGTGITARVVAVQGDDITDVTAFRGALRSLATSGAYVKDNINMSELNGVFGEIANDIVNAWTQTSFTMITPEVGTGTRMRMVFGTESAENARYYIEGEVTVRNREYYLTNVRYGGGLGSSVPSGGEIKGTIDRRSVHYNFSGFTGYDLSNAKISQWLITSGSNVWQINSEYNSAGASRRNIQRHNALVYLVLDRSSSIKPEDVPKVQQAAKNFIQILQNTYWQK